MSHDRFVEELTSGARCAFDAGMIDEPAFQRVRDEAAAWYAPIRDRGIRAGDWAIYQIRGNSMRSTLQSDEGELFVDQVDRGPRPRRTLLAAYLAPCSDFRQPLIESLFLLSSASDGHVLDGIRPSRAVVDPRLRVPGVDGLWVADASVMPAVPRGHPNAVVATIASVLPARSSRCCDGGVPGG